MAKGQAFASQDVAWCYQGNDMMWYIMVPYTKHNTHDSRGRKKWMRSENENENLLFLDTTFQTSGKIPIPTHSS